MKYIDHGRGGDADVLQLAERDMPEVGAGEVLIRVAYAGVNRPDVLQRMGSYPPPRGASPWLGLEVAGVVAAVGQGVPEWKKGDRVCALVDGGGYRPGWAWKCPGWWPPWGRAFPSGRRATGCVRWSMVAAMPNT